MQYWSDKWPTIASIPSISWQLPEWFFLDDLVQFGHLLVLLFWSQAKVALAQSGPLPSPNFSEPRFLP